MEIKCFLHIMWSHDQWVMWLGGWDTLILNHKGYSKSNRTNNKNMYVLQIGQACVTNQGNRYYKIGQLLQIGA